MSDYYPGSVVRMEARFSRDGVSVQPGVVTCRVKKPDRTVAGTPSTMYDATNPADPFYYADHLVATTDPSGIWSYRFETSVSDVTALEATFIVKKSQF